MLGKFSAVIELLMDQNADLNLEDGGRPFEGGTTVCLTLFLRVPPPLTGFKKDTTKNTAVFGGPAKKRQSREHRWVHAHLALDHPFSTALLFVLCLAEWLIWREGRSGISWKNGLNVAIRWTAPVRVERCHSHTLHVGHIYSHSNVASQSNIRYVGIVWQHLAYRNL